MNDDRKIFIFSAQNSHGKELLDHMRLREIKIFRRYFESKQSRKENLVSL
jgi:hypothetical protein